MLHIINNTRTGSQSECVLEIPGNAISCFFIICACVQVRD